MEKIINCDLKDYIENNILTEYKFNDIGHGINHVNFVLCRAYELSEKYDIDYDMLYTIVCYHDVACYINRDKHEQLSAERLYNDLNLKKFFNDEQLIVMRDAVYDHRASLDYIPRNIYGKILSSADRKIDVDDYLKTSIGINRKKDVTLSFEKLIEMSYNFACKKFGVNGYAVKKMYIDDKKYEQFLKEIQYLISHKKEFIKREMCILEDDDLWNDNEL